MTDPARLLLVAAVLSSTAIATFAWRVHRLDEGRPERLIGEMRLAQWAALVLTTVGALTVGQALAGEGSAFGWDVAACAGLLALAGSIMQTDPRNALLLAAAGFVGQALVLLAHRPGVIWPTPVPRWFVIGGVAFDVVLATVCYGVRRR